MMLNRKISLDHVARIVGFRDTANYDSGFRIAKSVSDFRLIAICAEDNVIAVASEIDGDDMGISVLANRT